LLTPALFRSIKPLFLAIRNPEAGEILRSMRKDLSHDITQFINEHAPELELNYKSESSSGVSSSVELSRSNSQTQFVLPGSNDVINSQSGK
jgi:hypothetical protein